MERGRGMVRQEGERKGVGWDTRERKGDEISTPWKGGVRAGKGKGEEGRDGIGEGTREVGR